jgi:hypothetical protein
VIEGASGGDKSLWDFLLYDIWDMFRTTDNSSVGAEAKPAGAEGIRGGGCCQDSELQLWKCIPICENGGV